LQVEYFSFDQQISCFESVKKAMIAKIGKDAAEETVNAAMFQIGLGKATKTFPSQSVRFSTVNNVHLLSF
jgi:hypothetical protein